ncbi:MAG: OB-fold nucleic acid binding domain-containing protein, partial [Lysobacterales bacterium]
MTSNSPMALTDLQGVGPKLAEKLNSLGVSQVTDLLFHLPLRYEDRTRIHPIGSCIPGQRVLIEGKIEHSAIVRGRRPMMVLILFDGTGRITLRFFHFRAFQQRQLASGTRLRCFAEVRAGFKGLEMVHPSYQRLSGHGDEPVADRLTPVYPGADGLGQKNWIKMTDQALALMRRGRLKLEELLPRSLLDELKLMPLADALDYIHRPPPDADVASLIQRDHPTQKRLALEELLAHN